MGSPYFVHKQSNRTHVVKTFSGLERVLKIIQNTMGTRVKGLSSEAEESYCAEWVVLNDIRNAFDEAEKSASRVVLFLEARYEWTGWEKFQRVIVIDMSRPRATEGVWVEPNHFVAKCDNVVKQPQDALNAVLGKQISEKLDLIGAFEKGFLKS